MIKREGISRKSKTSADQINFLLRHKKGEDLETWDHPAVLHTYVERQAILEPILLYQPSK